MKIIGRNMEGGVLLELSLVEYIDLMTASNTLATLPNLPVVNPPEASPAVATVKPDGRRKKWKPAGKSSTEKETRLCAWCEKPLPKNAYALIKTHPGKCKLLYNRRKANERYQAEHGKKSVAVTVNPADPTLSEEERKAARLEIIKRSAENHAEE